jgi:hypothetical protein
MIVLVLWSALVSQLVSTTVTREKCKEVKCEVKIQEIGYKIEVVK